MFPKKFLSLRLVKYLSLAALCNGLLFFLSLSYLKKTPPTFISTLIVHVAGSGPGVSVNLPSIGQANTSSATAFGSHSDPRENYKLMATSGTVLKIAAESLEIEKSKLGKPNVNLINNTTLLKFETKANTPEEAREKAGAIYEALSKRLETLRIEEQLKRDKAVSGVLSDAEDKLIAAQKKIAEYKRESGLNSSDQIKELIKNLGSLQIQYIQAQANFSRVDNSLQQQSGTLGLLPQEAADALVLQTDQEFQKILTKYTDINAELIELRANRGNNYPDVVKLRRERDSTLSSLMKRGQLLLGKPLDKTTLQRLILDNGNGSGVKRADLFADLIDLQGEKSGLFGKISTLQSQIDELESLLASLTQKGAILDTLDRDLQIAQAVFASTLTKIDLSKGDPFASFPMMQIIEEPTLPDSPSAPKPALVIAGTIIGCFFISTGLTILFWREPLLLVSRKVLLKIIE